MEWRKLLPCSLLFVGACTALAPILQDTPTSIPSFTPTPSATAVPLAAIVNEEPIPLEEYALEVARFERAQATLGIALNTLGDYPKRVLQSMIEERVAAQAAKTAGLSVTQEKVEAAYQTAEKARGGPDGMQTWLKDNLYTEASFRVTLQRQMLVQAITAQIADQVPSRAEQVHARHILVGAQATADYLLSLLAQGLPFDQLARKYSQDLSTRDNGGDLGWFARGTLQAPEVETAAFALEANQISPAAVKSALGFHIIQTLEKESDRPLSSAAYARLRQHAIEAWLANQVAQAKLQILLNSPSS
jgi:parvulin-like peptidyl-prolyl isomerase